MTLEPNKIITGEALYKQAIDLILSRAQHQLLLFDQDLRQGGFTSLDKFTALNHFLTGHVASQLTIILQDDRYFRHQCPRLTRLLEIYGHKMHLRITNDAAKHAKDCFILADGQHYIKRIHIDHARFRYAFNDPLSAEALHNRFLQLLEASEAVSSLKPLGL